MINEKHFMGRDGFYWFFGKVVDRNDTLGIGRVRVRVFGIHPMEEDSSIPNDHLPWAIPIQPITSAGIFGVGSSATGLIPGSYVFGFFADGQDAQIPVIIGSVASSLGHYVVSAVDSVKQKVEAAASAAINSVQELLTGGFGGNIAKILNLLARYESGADGYNSVIGYPHDAREFGPAEPIVSKTVKEVLAYGDKLRRTQGTTAQKLNSSAMGRYQFVGSTIRDYVKNGFIKESDVFDPTLQDKLCVQLMKESGADPYAFLEGKLNVEQCISRWATKWQSWPLNPNNACIPKGNIKPSLWKWTDLVTQLNNIKNGQ